MRAMLKNRLFALFACGFATGVLANCAPAQDYFIRQPGGETSTLLSNQVDSEKSNQPRQYITQRPSQSAAASSSGPQIAPLRPPAGNRTAYQTRTAKREASSASDQIQWVPRDPSDRLALPQMRSSAPPKANAWPQRTQPVPSSLASWPLLPIDDAPNEGIQLELESASALPPAQPQRPAQKQVAATQPSATEQPTASVQTTPQTAVTSTPMPVAAAQPSAAERRSEMAALVSQNILGDTDSQPPLPVNAVDNPEGWNSIGKRLAGHIRNCNALLSRRAYFSAREEAKIAIAHLMQTIDLHEGTYESELGFVAAMTALREAQDFTDSGAAHGAQTVSVIVGAHSSDILKQYDVTSVSPLAAAEHYRIGATNKLVAAAKNHPWASELYYTLGRIEQAEAESSAGAKQANLRRRAITLYRAAAAINPNNAIALNQLGVVFLQMDRPRDASEALVEAVRLGSTPEAAGNLVAASQQLGDQKLLAWAQQNARPTRAATQQPQRPNVVLVPGQAFAAMNPPPTIGRPPQMPARVPAQPVGYRR